MVVLAASILNKSGRVILSRQFVEISRSRIEGLLTAFPKLVGTGRSHTFVETESVRYVYQPMDQLYLLLITNRSSNIIEDLETLRTFGKVACVLPSAFRFGCSFTKCRSLSTAATSVKTKSASMCLILCLRSMN